MIKDIKHSKFKNPIIIYQILIRKMVQQASSVDKKKKSVAYKIIGQFFNKSTQLSKQLYLYNIINETKETYPEGKANQLLDKVLQMRKKLNQVKLQKEKYHCIKKIKEHFQLKQLFSTNLSNYKVYGSIYKLFQSLKNSMYDPKSVVDAKYIIIENLMKQKQKDTILQDFKKNNTQMKQYILQLLIEKFSKQYDTSLNDQQKDLLTNYIITLSEDNQFDKYIGRKVQDLKQKLQKSEKLRNEKERVGLLSERLNNVNNLKDMKQKVYVLMSVYQILKENKEK